MATLTKPNETEDLIHRVTHLEDKVRILNDRLAGVMNIINRSFSARY